ncbi:radical SAM protein [Carboxylicivirga sp. N1Y90]|uniref:SPL family radical SAM protein n=1 Tax=Carboxylicivirga fragile TaxID=3417571 RepID=UPI003D337275|nr:radical SAM protein [Marinilabiliaceae bacterium N1Y90]
MKYIQAKKILSVGKPEGDPWFGTSYTINLYRGCTHGCIYCDSRSDCYRINDFDQIEVKQNALELLHRELKSKRQRRTIGFGSMNDCYMPIEEQQRRTRRALEIILHHKFPIHIITKGTLVTRDTDLLKQISKVYAAVSFTITAANDELAKKIEPQAPSSTDRFKALKQLREAGIYAGITLMPILPFINDSIDNIKQIVAKAAESNASYIIASMGMTNRDGQREYFYKKLDQSFPEVKQKYMNQFGNDYSCASPNAKLLWQTFNSECNKYKIPTKMAFYKPINNQQTSLF